MENKSSELEVAIRAAKEAGKILEKYFEKEILKEFKADNSVVTKADGEAEEAIKKVIWESFPNHSILGEETGHTKNGGEHTWHIDPLDGTRNFSNGIPLFAVSIALDHKDKQVLGVVYNPATRSLFYAEAGKGAYLNGKKISVSGDDAPRSIISSGKSRKDIDRKLCRKLMQNLPDRFPGLTVRDFGSAALDLAYVACGGFEATIHLGLNSYDFAAGTILVEEAGGKITTLQGGAWQFPQNYFVASNGVFHDKLVEQIKNDKEELGID